MLVVVQAAETEDLTYIEAFLSYISKRNLRVTLNLVQDINDF